MEKFDKERSGHDRRITEGCGEVCADHSGTVTGIRGLYALLVILISLVGAQMMFQIPAIKIDILTEVKGITARIVELEKRDIEFSGRLSDLERQRIK